VDTKEFKKMVAGLGVAGLIAGAGLGVARAADKTGGSG